MFCFARLSGGGPGFGKTRRGGFMPPGVPRNVRVYGGVESPLGARPRFP